MRGKLTVAARHPWFIALAVCAGIPRPAAAQSLLAIADEAGECAVELREVLRLGAPGDPGTIGSRPEITRTAAGRYVVASVENRGQLLAFDADGAFLETLGGNGDGPGEYRVPGRMRPGADGSLRILDLVNRRITHVSPEGGLLATTDIRSLHGLDFVTLAAGERHAVSGFGQMDDRLSATTEIVGSDGVRLASLGGVPVASWVVNFFRAPVALDEQGRVWMTRAGEYAFEAWDPGRAAGPATRLAGEPDWFDPGPPQPGAPVSAPAPSIVISLRFDRDLLWAGTWVADETREAGAAAAPSPLELDRLLDTVLDVIDPASGALVARTRRDEALRGTGDDALLFGVREDGGIPRAVLFEPALAGPDCPPRSRRGCERGLIPGGRADLRGGGLRPTIRRRGSAQSGFGPGVARTRDAPPRAQRIRKEHAPALRPRASRCGNGRRQVARPRNATAAARPHGSRGSVLRARRGAGRSGPARAGASGHAGRGVPGGPWPDRP